jgi:hypothetical protein
MRTSRWIAAVAVSAGVLAPGAALAGEVNGQGEYIHGDADTPLPAHSLCAYSGIEDHAEYEDLESNTKPGQLTQTPHYVFDDENSGTFVNPPPGTPRFTCRGN